MVPGLVLASMMAVAPSAPPVSSGRVLVLDTVAPGIAAADREELDARIARVLAARDIPLASTATREAARACKSTVCRERTAADRGITHWVRAEVSGEDREYRVTIAAGTIADSIEGPALASSTGECSVCGVAELSASIESHTVELRDRLLAMAEDRSRPAPRAQLRPARSDRDPFRDEGSRTRVDPMRPAGLALLAAGSASAIGGAVLLGLDGNDVRRRCTADNVDADGDCRFVHETLVPGIAMVSGGILAVAGGITLVSIERRRRGRTDVRARLGYNRIVISGKF